MSIIREYLLQKPPYDEPPQKTPPKRVEPPKKEVKPPPSEMEALFESLAPDLVVDPPIVLLWKEKSDLPFLEKVATAITKSVALAECRPWSEEKSSASLMIASAALLNLAPHTLCKKGRPAKLALYPVTEYMKNVELKRTLWNLLNSNDLLV
ncbi:MAG: hypothetical protein H7A36_02720 [Chlamydiales bacterium]|nr:hypothetical protein [Chlamydiales bacterium]